jgi:hypothetical protein
LWAADDPVDLDGPRRIADLELVDDATEDRLPGRACERVGADRARLRQGALEVRHVVGLGDDLGALRDRSADAAGMVEVDVAVDDGADRLAGRKQPRRPDACVRASFSGAPRPGSADPHRSRRCFAAAANQTPSTTFSAVTRSAVLRAASGIGRSSAGLTCTSLTARSRTGKPPMLWRTRIGNWMPSTARYSS